MTYLFSILSDYMLNPRVTLMNAGCYFTSFEDWEF